MITISSRVQLIPLTAAILGFATGSCYGQYLTRNWHGNAWLPAPLGTYNHAWQCGQISAAHEVLAIHKCDWKDGTCELSPFMQRYLQERIVLSKTVVNQIFIEPSGSLELDQIRSSRIADYLAECQIEFSPNAIVIGYVTRDRVRGDGAATAIDKFTHRNSQTSALYPSAFSPYAVYAAPVGGPVPFNTSAPTATVEGALSR